VKAIIKIISNPSRGSWTKKVLNYWQAVFDLEIDRLKAELALIVAAVKQHQLE